MWNISFFVFSVYFNLLLVQFFHVQLSCCCWRGCNRLGEKNTLLSFPVSVLYFTADTVPSSVIIVALKVHLIMVLISSKIFKFQCYRQLSYWIFQSHFIVQYRTIFVRWLVEIYGWWEFWPWKRWINVAICCSFSLVRFPRHFTGNKRQKFSVILKNKWQQFSYRP